MATTLLYQCRGLPNPCNSTTVPQNNIGQQSQRGGVMVRRSGEMLVTKGGACCCGT